LKRKTIDLPKTKNGSTLTVPLNFDGVEAIESPRRPKQHGSDTTFQREVSKTSFDTAHGSVQAWKPRALVTNVALQPAHLLFLAGDGRGKHQGDSGSCRTLVDHDVGRHGHLSPAYKLSMVEGIVPNSRQSVLLEDIPRMTGTI
jgi:hypothetical protein